MDILIRRALPLVDSETITKVAGRLIDLGVIGDDDLQFVEVSDIDDLLKPIQVRKLLKFFDSREKAKSLNSEIKILIENVSSADSTATLKECSSTPIVDLIAIKKECSSPPIVDLIATKKDCPSPPIVDSTVRLREFIDESSADPTLTHEDCPDTQSAHPTSRLTEFLSMPNPEPIVSQNYCPSTQNVEPILSHNDCPSALSVEPIVLQNDCPSIQSVEPLVSQNDSPSTQSVEPIVSQNVCPSTQSVGPSVTQIESPNIFGIAQEFAPEDNFEIPWKLFPEEVLKACASKKPINRVLRCRMLRILVREASRKCEFTKKKQFKVLAEKIVSKYPDTFQDRIDDTVMAGGCLTLLKCITSSFENSRRKRTWVKDTFSNDSEEPVRKSKKTMRNSYGTSNWEPYDLPSGETKKSLEEKKEFLIQEYSKKQFSEEKVTDAMMKTYISQRYFINDEIHSIQDIQREWPFLLDEKYMLMHYETLMNQNVYKLFLEGIPVKGKKIYDFLKTKTSNSSIKRCVKEIKEAKLLQKSLVPETKGSFLLLMAYFEEKIEYLFRTFKNAKSVTDFEAKNTKTTPFIGVLGENFYLSEKYIIFLDGKATTFVNNFTVAISVLFAAFYNFNIDYPVEASLTLEFIQRCYAKINPETGTKVTRRPNHKQVPLPPRIRRLIEDLKHF